MYDALSIYLFIVFWKYVFYTIPLFELHLFKFSL